MSFITLGKSQLLSLSIQSLPHSLSPFSGTITSVSAILTMSTSFTSLNHFPSFVLFSLIIQFTKFSFSSISSDSKQLHWVLNLVIFFSTWTSKWLFPNFKKFRILVSGVCMVCFLLVLTYMYHLIMFLHFICNTFRTNLGIWMIIFQRG